MSEKKMTNAEIMAEVAAMNETKAAEYGVNADLQKVASIYAVNPQAAVSRISSVIGNTYSPLYNSFNSLLSKLVFQGIESAEYSDVYSRHDFGFTPGIPEFAFMSPAKDGTGNTYVADGAYPGSSYNMTTQTTAEVPDITSTTVRKQLHIVKRVPVTYEQQRSSLLTDTGISDLVGALRKALADGVKAVKNEAFDNYIAEAEGNIYVPGASGSVKGTVPSVVGEFAPANVTFDGTSLDAMRAFLAQLQVAVMRVIGEPTGANNYAGVKNNMRSNRVTVYIPITVWAALRVYLNASATNMSELYPGVDVAIQPTDAAWLGDGATLATSMTGGETTKVATAKPLALVAANDWIGLYTNADEDFPQATDIGQIITHRYKGWLTHKPWAPAILIMNPAAE